MSQYKFLIASGWFSDTQGKTTFGKKGNIHQEKYGGTFSRSVEFSKYWLSSILQQSILPEKITIVDACSPDDLHEKVKMHPLIEISKQVKNFGRLDFCIGASGWSRGFIHGAMNAYINDLDFVYIEQDLLLFGKDFLKNVFDFLKENNKYVCYMNGDETPQPLQQSFVIVKHAYLYKFISDLLLYEKSHGQKISEEKKHYEIVKECVLFCPYKGGRQRKNLDQNNFCLQHMTEEEIKHYISIDLIKDILK